VVWIQIASQSAQEKMGIKAVIFNPTYMSKEITDQLEFEPVSHTEELEGSYMLYIHSELTDFSKDTDYTLEGNDLYYIDIRYTGDTLYPCYVPSAI